MVQSQIEELVNRYFGQIEVEDTDYIPVDDSPHDAAYILLRIPTAMLKDYLMFKGQNKELPDGVEFWRETGLAIKLRGSNKYHGQGHEPLDDMLDFLEGDVHIDYQKITEETMRLSINEIHCN